MRILVIFFYTSFLFVLSWGHLSNGNLDEKDLDYIKQKKIIKVCINPDWAPIEFRENKQAKGISIDILKQISKKIGLKLNFVFTPTWVDSQRYLKEGKCDITPTAIKTSKREKYAIFTRPYLNYDLAIITTQDKPYVTDINAIIDKTITRKKGSGLITKLKKRFPNIKIVEARNFVEMFKLVSDQKVYATIATLPVFAYYKKRYNFYNLKIAGFTGWKYPLRIMVNKNETILKHILDSELDLITPKTTQTIYEKWIVNTKSNTDYKKLMIIGIIIIVLFIIILIWVYILHKKNIELRKLSEIKSKFLSNMSHELRTPLNALIGFVQIIKNNPEECKNYISLVDSSSKIILSEIDDILNFDRLQKDVKIHNIEFKIEEIKNIIYFAKFQAEKKGLKFNLYINSPQYLYGDIEKIRNILSHLLDNAVKFTKNGSININIIYKEETLFVSIIDTGIGIPKDKLKLIFKEFYQLDQRINKDYKGLGIGLSISERLVRILGGNLKVESEVDKGSKFTFLIPIKKSDKQDIKVKFENKILIVEDNKANQMFMQVLLKQLHIDFDIAQNGLEAVNMYKDYKYPIILMDINMPIMDGITATKEIRKYEETNNIKNAKIVAITANAIDGDEEKFNEIMDGYIPKPVDINKLKELFK